MQRHVRQEFVQLSHSFFQVPELFRQLPGLGGVLPVSRRNQPGSPDAAVFQLVYGPLYLLAGGREAALKRAAGSGDTGPWNIGGHFPFRSFRLAGDGFQFLYIGLGLLQDLCNIGADLFDSGFFEDSVHL